MCLKESLRLFSPVPFIQREFTHDFEVEGRTFPAGTPVTVHIYGLHHNEDVWENPTEYNPERFNKDNLAKMDTYQFVPFSAGPRFVCYFLLGYLVVIIMYTDCQTCLSWLYVETVSGILTIICTSTYCVHVVTVHSILTSHQRILLVCLFG